MNRDEYISELDQVYKKLGIVVGTGDVSDFDLLRESKELSSEALLYAIEMDFSGKWTILCTKELKRRSTPLGRLLR